MLITFATTCRSRLYDLQRTLPVNLKLLLPGERIIVLDYNSPDGLWDWLLSLREPLREGKLEIYRERKAPRFFMSHAKNVAHLLAYWWLPGWNAPFTGKPHTTPCVVVGLDADNYLDPSYLRVLRDCRWETVGCLYPLSGHGGFKGRVGLRADVFSRLGGYDEQMCLGYGWEDLDVYKRCILSGIASHAHVDISNRFVIPTSPAGKEQAQLHSGMSFNDSMFRHGEIAKARYARGQWWVNSESEWGAAEVETRYGALFQVAHPPTPAAACW